MSKSTWFWSLNIQVLGSFTDGKRGLRKQTAVVNGQHSIDRKQPVGKLTFGKQTSSEVIGKLTIWQTRGRSLGQTSW